MSHRSSSHIDGKSERSSKSSKLTHTSDTKFRSENLAASNVFFKKGVPASTPPTVSSLLSTLSRWNWRYTDIDDKSVNEADWLTEEERRELLTAVASAHQVEDAVIMNCEDRNESFWMTYTNPWVLRTLLKPAGYGLLTSTIDQLWTEGPRGEELADPKPDMAFGIGYEDNGILCQATLHQLRKSLKPRLVISPVETLEHLLFPSVVYEAKSDKTLPMPAENQAAVGAKRALDVLAELSLRSEVPHQHCVVALVSSGTRWEVFVAYQDLVTKTTHLVPVYKETLQMRHFHDRVRLICILGRILRWMQTAYRDKVAEQLQRLYDTLDAPPAP